MRSAAIAADLDRVFVRLAVQINPTVVKPCDLTTVLHGFLPGLPYAPFYLEIQTFPTFRVAGMRIA